MIFILKYSFPFFSFREKKREKKKIGLKSIFSFDRVATFLSFSHLFLSKSKKEKEIYKTIN